eukprot:3539072-Prymnesium_polylepis.1
MCILPSWNAVRWTPRRDVTTVRSAGARASAAARAATREIRSSHGSSSEFGSSFSPQPELAVLEGRAERELARAELERRSQGWSWRQLGLTASK